MSTELLSRPSKENWFVTTTALFPRSSVCVCKSSLRPFSSFVSILLPCFYSQQFVLSA